MIGNGELLHYLDDFLFGGANDNDCWQQALDNCISLCNNIGVHIAEGKTEGP